YRIQNTVFGLPKEYFQEGLDDKIKKTIEEVIKKIKSQGATIKEVSLPSTSYALPCYYIIMPAEASSNLARFDGIRYSPINNYPNLHDLYFKTRGKGFGAEVRRRIVLGTYVLSSGYYDAYYKKAQKVRQLIKDDFSDAFEKVHYIFTPTTPEVAFKIGAKTNDPMKMYLSDIYTVPMNLAGVPAISFPIGTVEDEGVDLPVGGQIIGKWFDEEGVLNASYTFEQNV
ncbi:MAG: Asp-tRNA(Asn)/Glu-tRNA(Gln) amidotransferase subunit GatA, partial [Candidatus Moranbacteria bacterium]|nr:Asp-tRNA(Asn)/Glu-tRNA(Gln) amidotransferase subunit GatA [Candidatus Moranbacteria bacterium]